MMLKPQLRLALHGVVDHHSLPDPADPRAQGPGGRPHPQPQTDRIQAQFLAGIPGPGSALPKAPSHLRIPAGIRTGGRSPHPKSPGLCQSIGAEPGEVLPRGAQPHRARRDHGPAQSPAQRTSQAFPDYLDPTPSPSSAQTPGPQGLRGVHGNQVLPIDIGCRQIPPAHCQACSKRHPPVRPQSGKIESLQAQRARPSRSCFHAWCHGDQGRIGFHRITFTGPSRIGPAATHRCGSGKCSLESATKASENCEQ